MSKENDIQKSVFKEIHTGVVSMRPKYYFILRVILIGIVSFLALVVSIFALSFAIFSIHESGEQILLGFGRQGFITFIALFPWWTSLLSIGLFIILGALLRNFKFAYRVPLLRVFLWTLAVIVVGSVLIGFTSLHSFLLDRADHDSLPIIGSLYEELHDSHQPQGVYRGDITSITGLQFVISHNDTDRDSDDGSWVIEPPPGFDMSVLSIGTKAYVAGRLQHGIVYAYGIRILPIDQ